MNHQLLDDIADRRYRRLRPLPLLPPQEAPHGQQVVDARSRLARRLHAAARHHDRRGRAAGYRTLARRRAVRSAMGGRRLRAVARRVPADSRCDRRPRRTARGVRHRHRRVHARLAALRPRRRPDLPRARPRRPGRRRRDHVRDVACAALDRVPRPRARHGVRGLRRRDRRRGRRRPGARRRDHQRPVVALDLLREPADRDPRPRRHAPADRRVPRSERPAAGLGGLRDVQRGAGAARVRADPLQRGRLGLDRGRRIADRSR